MQNLSKNDIVDLERIVKKAKGEQKPQELTKQDLINFIKKTSNDPVMVNVAEQIHQKDTKPSDQQKKFATLAMRDAKTISIIGLISIVTPMIAVLVAMMDQAMFAIMIGMLVNIYPIWHFVKAIGQQTYLSKKYNLKPLFKFPEEQQQIQQQQQIHPPQQEFRL